MFVNRIYYETFFVTAINQEPTSDGLSYIYCTPLMAKLGLQIHTVHKILICISCETAWLPSSIKTHLRGHKINFTSDEAAELIKTIVDSGVNQTYQVPIPKPGGPPVEHLKLYSTDSGCLGMQMQCKACFLQAH